MQSSSQNPLPEHVRYCRASKSLQRSIQIQLRTAGTCKPAREFFTDDDHTTFCRTFLSNSHYVFGSDVGCDENIVCVRLHREREVQRSGQIDRWRVLVCSTGLDRVQSSRGEKVDIEGVSRHQEEVRIDERVIQVEVRTRIGR